MNIKVLFEININKINNNINIIILNHILMYYIQYIIFYENYKFYKQKQT